MRRSSHAGYGRRVRRVQLVLLLGLLTAFGPIAVDMLPSGAAAAHARARHRRLGGSADARVLPCRSRDRPSSAPGPLSDRFGRRAPLLVGVAVFVAASLACAAAPTAAALIAFRFIQGLLGAGAGIAIARAVARDLTTGDALARFLSLLMLMNGLAPILAPVIGAQLLRVTSWHGIFVVLAAIGAVALLGVIFVLHETLPPDERQPGGFADVRATTKELLGDHAFVGYLLVLAFSTGAMFAYIAGFSPFVIEDIHGGSPQLYGAIFALNGAGIVGASQLNRRLLRRHSALTLLGAGVVASACGGLRTARGRRGGNRAGGDDPVVLRARCEHRHDHPERDRACLGAARTRSRAARRG